MEKVDLPPLYETVVNVTAPSTERDMLSDEIEKPKTMEEPLVERLFDDNSTRKAFTQKMLLFILLQGITTALLMIPFVLCTSFQHNSIFAFTSLAVYLFVIGVLYFFEVPRIRNPERTILFVVYPAVVAAFMGFSNLGLSIGEMYVAYISYCVTIFAVLVYSILILQSNLDYKLIVAMFISAVVLLASFGLATVIYSYRLDMRTTFLYIIGMFLECIYTVWDIQMITSPKYRYVVSPNDFVVGVLLLRIDLIYYIVTFIKKYTQILIGFKD